MGLFDKLKGIVNPETIDDNYDEEYNMFDEEEATEYPYEDYQGQGQGQQHTQQGGGYQNQQQPRPQNQYQQQTNNNMPAQQGQNAVEINSAGGNLSIRVIVPERYDSARQIADQLLNRRTVVLNLEKMTKEDARRMIEFLSGVIYSISGGIKRIKNDTFLLAPNNVDVASAAAEQQINQQVNRDIFNN